MSRLAVFRGTYSDMRFVKSRGVGQLIVEFPLEEADRFIREFGAPNPASEVPIAIARLAPEAKRITANDKPEAITDRRRWDDLPLSQQAAIRCGEKAFWVFLYETSNFTCLNAEMAADAVRKLCGVASRKHIQESADASAKWVEIDSRYQLWLRGVAA